MGLFAESSIGGVRGAFYGDGGSLIACQLLGVGITVCWSGVMSLLLIKVMLKYCDVDVSVEVEECGLDLAQVGEQAYDDKVMRPPSHLIVLL